MTTLCVIIPVKNEQDILEKTVLCVDEELKKANLDFQIVIVDDGSTDQTWNKLKSMTSRFPMLTGVRLTRNFGKDAALFVGLKSAEADCYITMDSDGQHPFSDVPAMVKLWQETGCDVVNAVKGSRGKENGFYRFSVSLFNKLMGEHLTNATEFKLLSRRTAKRLVSMQDFDIFYRALVPWIGFDQRNFIFDVAEGMRKTGSFNFRALSKFALSGMVMFKSFPIRCVFAVGLLTLILCIVLGVKLALELMLGSVSTGYSTLLVLMMMNLSFTMLGLSVIGMYVHANLHQSINRPRAIVHETVASGEVNLSPEPIVL